MVYCGRPSQGCGNCRKQHLKCDRKQPECSRCLRLKQTCPGYRNQVDLMFRSENKRTKENAEKSYARNRARPRDLIDQTHCSLPFRLKIGETSTLLSDNGTWLSTSVEDVVVCDFYYSTLEQLSNEDDTRFLHAQLPALYSKSPLRSALRLSTQAIAFACSTKTGHRAAEMSRGRYVLAVKAVEKAIRDPVEVKADQTLYAILLLSGFETLMFDSETIPAWGSHVDGAVALVNIRDQTELISPLSRSLLSFVRKKAVLSNIQISQPLETVFHELDTEAPSRHDKEECLILMMAKVPQVQHQAKSLLRPSDDDSDKSIEKLFNSAGTLDSELLEWAKTAKNSWMVSAAMNLNPPSTSKYTPLQIHKYSNFYIARVWNMYRVSRLVLQSIMLRAISSMPSSSVQATRRSTLERSSQELIDGICASVSFLLGQTPTEMSATSLTKLGVASTTAHLENSNATKHAPARAGRFSLILPLYIACGASIISEEQRGWMRAQLRLIAECGDSQAQFAQCTESQILTGGIEQFRFDCV